MHRLLPLLLLPLLGCSEPQPEANPEPITRACTGLTAVCSLPFPSSTHTVADPDSPTGRRVELSEQADFGGAWAAIGQVVHDGFSPAGSIATWLPEGGLEDDLPSDFAGSAWETSPIALVIADATSARYGERASFRAELVSSEEGPGQLLVLTPLHRLEADSRYAVVIDDRLRTAAGDTQVRDPGMDAILSPEEADDDGLWAYAQDLLWLAENVLALERESLVQVFDFHTRSEQSLVTDLQDMAAWTRAWMEETPPTIEPVEVGRTTSHARWAFEVTVPIWKETRDDLLSRGEDGLPEPARFEALQGTLVLPDHATVDNPAQAILFGHGVGVDVENMIPLFNHLLLVEQPWAVFAIDWDLHGTRGRGLDDILELTGALNVLAYSASQLQNAIDSLVLTRAVQNAGQVGGRIQTEPGFYLGQSLGGLVGVLGASVNPDLRAAVLNVTGGGYSTVLRRGQVIDALGMRSAIEYAAEQAPPPDLPLDLAYDLLLTMAQLGLDTGDPMATAPHLLRDRFEGAGPAPAILMQESIGDGVMPNDTTEALARTIGVPWVQPGIERPAGLDVVDAPTCGAPASGLTQFRTSDIPFQAHLALDDGFVQEQVLRWFGSFIDDDAANDGNIAFGFFGQPVDCP